MAWDSKERRKFVRVKLPCEVTVHIPNQYTISTYTENISAGGIKLTTEERLKPNSIVELDLYGISEKPMTCKGKLKWVSAKKNCLTLGDPLYSVGIEFFQIKKKDIIQIKGLITSLISDNE